MDVELCLSQARLPLPAGCVLYDVHAHLSWPDFDADLDAVMQRAKAIGVDGIAVLSMDATEQQRINDICDRYDICHPGFGFHPKHVSATSAAESTIALAAVLKCYPSSRACCVGEIGLDSSPRVLEASGLPHEEVKEIQRRVLEEEIALACLLTPPLTLNVHSRGAGHHTITFIASCLAAIADQSKRPCVLMHAFDGKCDYAVKAVEEHGFCFSVAPSVVRDIQLQKLVLALPLANLLLESDSPRLDGAACVSLL
jgi:TatD DNase family protein